MKHAILADVHGNLDALEAVLSDAEAQGVDRLAVAGDVVGYGAEPRACLNRLRELDAVVVRGNHDHYAGTGASMNLFTPSAQDGILWTRKRLSHADRRFLSNLPPALDADGFSLVHASLRAPLDWAYVVRPAEATAAFLCQSLPICFFGHVHVPFAFLMDDAVRRVPLGELRIEENVRYLVNVGSVGQPRDRDPRAAYAIYDDDAGTVRLRRVEYDVAAAQRKIREAGLPFRNALRLAAGR